MKELNRRDFLRTGLLATGAFFVSLSPLQKLVAANAVPSSGFNKLLLRRAKAYFFQKDWTNAVSSYKQFITESPDLIVGYDGLARTFYAQNKSLEAAEVYRQGWLTRQNNPLFNDRLARAMTRLVAGNSKAEKAFCTKTGETDLLESASKLYLNAIDKTKGKPLAYLALGLLDVKHTTEKLNKARVFAKKPLLSLATTTLLQIDQTTQVHRTKWEESRRNRKKSEYHVTSEILADNRESNHKNKSRRDLNFEDEKKSRLREQVKANKELYYTLFEAAIKNKDTQKVEKFHQKIVASDSRDINATGQLITHYRKQKEYSKLVKLQSERYHTNADFWTTASYAQALRLQAKGESKQHLYTQALGLYQGLATGANISSREYLCAWGGQLDCLIQLNRYAEVRTLALQALEPFAIGILPFALTYLKTLTLESNYALAEDGYKLLLSDKETQAIAADPIYRHLKSCRQRLAQATGDKGNAPGFGVKKEVLFDIYYGLADLYHKKGDRAGERTILREIKKQDPNNAFVKKRKG
ncbi:MAG: tetratricopeptide repeat protein [Bacteroidales bacterium]